MASSSEKRDEVQRACLQENNACATQNRQYLNKHSVLALNIVSAPGSGKTSLLETTIDALRTHKRCRSKIGVITGDIETDLDWRRFDKMGIPAVPVKTGCAGHLDAKLVHDAVHRLDLENIDILFIENVGNLVCPANFDLGHHQNVALLGITEGDDKPLKYPAMFRAADMVLLSKADLLKHLDGFSTERAEAAIRSLGNEAPVIPISAKRNEYFGLWVNWVINIKAALERGAELRPRIHTDGLVLHAAQ